MYVNFNSKALINLSAYQSDIVKNYKYSNLSVL